MLASLKRHWPEYLMEAAGLGIFMVSAAVVATLLEHPSSPVRQAISDPLLRRIPMGVAMGLTAMAIIYSPWGKQSGAHINPSITLTFFRLGKIAHWDALFYGLAQFLGGLAGVCVVSLVANEYLADPSVAYVATRPGSSGFATAFVAEVFISYGLMLVVLMTTNHARLASFTGVFAGCLVAVYIIVEAPLSGMSMNPARTFASALPGWLWTGLWIYFTAPPLGMLLAAETYLRVTRTGEVICAKLHHQNDKRCIFRCGYRKGENGDGVPETLS